MTPICPHCKITSESRPQRPTVVRTGRFYRKSDSQWIQRFHCQRCSKGFSHATWQPCYRQKKRHLNSHVRNLLCSCVSLRRTALILKLNRKTVVRKFLFLSTQAALRFETSPPDTAVTQFQFDDMETHEHTKCKPLSITLAVDKEKRRILGLEVSVMPAKGKLAAISRKKYGKRPDERPKARKKLFEGMKNFIHSQALIQSDQNPHYPIDVKAHFPEAKA